MFSKILIANRGEIACRVIKTCKRLGIKTVAVYSEADDGALHMRQADEAVPIGKAPASESYLLVDRIVAACRETGADAVHPGYGFLSENRAFAAKLKDAGIVFIGPSPEAILAMGDKIESKKLAHKAGVSSVPGHLGAVSDDAEAMRIAREIGYPVMLKASAGGGGKGMRIARSDADIEPNLRSARNEARGAFGDDRVFVEKYIEEPRHVEIQILGDQHGTILYLGERECSIQRRHQKVIEEAPSPLLDAKTRKAMGDQAVALARAVGYYSAGTVEFIADVKRNFYFLEMNTRLQVEHPITELVTGIDIVEQMIRVAAGEKLALRQADIKLNGWAIEARIYAEDPYRGFLPSIGRLTRWRHPPEGGGVRLDTGVVEGSEISIYYDPLIAKLCAHGADRNEAIARLRAALDETWVSGVGHNVNFLAAVLAQPRFQEGRLSTGFIAETWPDGFKGVQTDAWQARALVAMAAYADLATRVRDGMNGGAPAERWRREAGERVVLVAGREHIVVPTKAAGGEAALAVTSGAPRASRTGGAPGSAEFTVDGQAVALTTPWWPGEPFMRAEVDGRRVVAIIRRRGEGFVLVSGGAEILAIVRSPMAAKLARHIPEKPPADTSRFLLCPMPGLVVSVNVGKGQAVKVGETLAVVEAMKMENVLRAERDGVIGRILAKKGDSLAVDAVILEFE
jgi:propionyl-CoA carboxylase alpha chain